MADQFQVQVIAFSPDLSRLSFLLKKEDLGSGLAPKYSFLDFSLPEHRGKAGDGLPQLEWMEGESEEAIMAKRDFFEFDSPIVGESLEEVIGHAKKIWEFYANNETIVDFKRRISEGSALNSGEFETMTTRLVLIGREVANLVNINSKKK